MIGVVAMLVATIWIALADCESGDHVAGPPYSPRWHYNGSSGFDGGLQFQPSTWSANRPRGYPSYAWAATPNQQAEVGRRVQRISGWGAWPVCSRMLRLR